VESINSVMAATGTMPTQMAVEISILRIGLQLMHVAYVVVAMIHLLQSLETPQLRMMKMKKMTARTVMESTHSVMAATGMMQTQVDAVFTIQMTSPPPTNAVPVEAVLVEMTKVRMMKRMNARMVMESTHSVMDATGMMPIQVHVEISILLISSLMMNAVYANE